MERQKDKDVSYVHVITVLGEHRSCLGTFLLFHSKTVLFKNLFYYSIAPNLRSIVYLAAIKYGGSDEWNHMFKIYQSTQFPSEQRKIMFALTDSKNKTILKR